MASEKDLELLDQYVSNRLTAQDRGAFEKKLDSDTSLKNEFNLQQRVVEKIREARIKELKTMFNNVPASALEPAGTSLVTQVTLGVAIVGAIGAGVYFYLNNNENKVADQTVAKQEETISEVPKAIEPQQETSKQEEPVTPDQKSSTEVVPPAENEKQGSETAKSANGKEEPKGPAPLDVFDPSEETEASPATPESAISESTPLNKSSIVVETDSNNKKYNFHYQFRNGKLYLYGTFEKNLYEIMEFFSDNKRTVFLYYKDSYYLLNEENETIKPLAPINDPSLLKKLKDYRGSR
jgi:hypothetical protein